MTLYVSLVLGGSDKKWQWQIKQLNTVFVCVYALINCVAADTVYLVNFTITYWICFISILTQLIKVSVFIITLKLCDILFIFFSKLIRC